MVGADCVDGVVEQILNHTGILPEFTSSLEINVVSSTIGAIEIHEI